MNDKPAAHPTAPAPAKSESTAPAAGSAEASVAGRAAVETAKTPEIGGRKGPDPTRYGDWEKDGRCIDF